MKPATTWCGVEKRHRSWRHNLIDGLFPTPSPPFTIELAMTSDGRKLLLFSNSEKAGAD